MSGAAFQSGLTSLLIFQSFKLIEIKVKEKRPICHFPLVAVRNFATKITQ